MFISEAYNKSLLMDIKKARSITYEDLRSNNAGMDKVIFDHDLQDLVRLGYVKESDGKYIFIHA